MASETFLRVIGKRRRPEAGTPPSALVRATMTTMANYETRVPRGVFIYSSHEEANRDWEKWRQHTMRANSRVPPHD